MGDHISLSAGCLFGLPRARSYCVGGLVRPTNATNNVLARTGHTVAGLRTQRDGRVGSQNTDAVSAPNAVGCTLCTFEVCVSRHSGFGVCVLSFGLTVSAQDARSSATSLAFRYRMDSKLSLPIPLSRQLSLWRCGMIRWAY